MKRISNLRFSPKELSYNVENESTMHKARIVAGAFVLAVISGTMQAYYDDLAFRATQAQIHFLAGNPKYDFEGDVETYLFQNMKRNKDTREKLWLLRNNLDIANDKSLKDKYIEKDWKTQISNVEEFVNETLINNWTTNPVDQYWTRPNQEGYQFAESRTYTRSKELGGVQDHQTSANTSGWFQQRQTKDDLNDAEYDKYVKESTWEGQIAFDAEQYNDWETFTDGLMWFDSIGCMDATKGGINNILFEGDETRDCYQQTNYIRTINQAEQERQAELARQQAELARQQALAAQNQANININYVPTTNTNTNYVPTTNTNINVNQNTNYVPTTNTNFNIPTLTPQQIEEQYRASIRNNGPIININDIPRQEEVILSKDQWLESQENFENGFYTGKQGCQPATKRINYSAVASNSDTVEYFQENATDLKRNQGRIRVYNEDSEKQFLEEYLDLIEDCDIDCQRSGSGLSLVAFLNGLVLGLIGLNAVFMFFGAWMSSLRIVSTYMNCCTCVAHCIVLVVSATCIFNQFATTLCSRSRELTGEGRLYTMADDYRMNVGLWFFQLFCVFGFLCCGLCGAYRAEGSGIVMMNSFDSNKR